MADITDVVRKAFYLGIGAISLTADKAQEFINELVDRGEMTREQGTSMVKELMKRGTETRREYRDMVKTEVKKTMDELDVPTKADMHRLEDKIDRLILMQRQSHAEVIESGEATPEVF